MHRRNDGRRPRGFQSKRDGSREFEALLVAAAGRPVFTADNFLPDPATGKAGSFVDHNDSTHLLAQATPTFQVAVPAAHADYRSARCVTFTGAQYYVSNRAATAWDFASSGAGFEVITAWTPVASAGRFLTTVVPGGGIGFLLYSATTSEASVRNGAGNIVIANTGTANGSPTYFDFQYLEGAGSPEYTLRKRSATVASGDSTGAPATPPSATMTLGAQLDGSAGGQFRFAFCGFFPVLTAAQRVGVQRFLEAAYGLTP